MKPNVKYAMIHRHRGKYALCKMCQFFEVSCNGYYKYVKQLEHLAKDSELAEKIRVKQESCKNPKTILRIMHKCDFLSEIRRRKKWRRMGEDKHKYDNWLNWEFNAEHPNQEWVTDISYIHTGEGVLYLSMIRDLYDRSIVAYKISDSQTVSLVLDTIHLCDEVCKNRKSPGVAPPQRPGVPIHLASIFRPD